MVVDDDADWREVLAAHLDAAGFTVIVASDGLRAWTRLQEAEPLVVVSDMQMPVMDGRELLEKVHARNYRVPVIILTACEALVRASELTGAFVVIAKSTEPDRIIAAVKAAVIHRQSSTPLTKLWNAAGVAGPRRGAPVRRAWWTMRRRTVAAIALSVIVVAAAAIAKQPRWQRT